MNEFNVVSFFDGISCGQLALIRARIKYNKYLASEIHQKSIDITKKNFPNTIQIGDITNQSADKILKICGNNVSLLLSGFPCQGFSICGKRTGLDIEENVMIETLEQYLQLKNENFKFNGTSYLFWESIRLHKELNPKYFFYENTKMKEKWKKIISKALGVEPVLINSSLFSAQNRERYYWTNIPIPQTIEDKGLTLSQIIPGAIAAGRHGRKMKNNPVKSKKGYSMVETVSHTDKAYCITTSPGTSSYYKILGIKHIYTPKHCEVLQTLPIGYTYIKGLCDTDRIKAIGNGWTIDVVSHFFKNIW
jgi:site-specific DNA-cytosine methylase